MRNSCTTAYATDLFDEHWPIIASLIPRPETGGQWRAINEQRVIDGILYQLKNRLSVATVAQ